MYNRTLHFAEGTQYIDCNIQVFLTNRRYKYRLLKPLLPNGSFY